MSVATLPSPSYSCWDVFVSIYNCLVVGYDITGWGLNAWALIAFDGLSTIAEYVGGVKLGLCNHFLLYNLTFVNFSRGLMMRA